MWKIGHVCRYTAQLRPIRLASTYTSTLSVIESNTVLPAYRYIKPDGTTEQDPVDLADSTLLKMYKDLVLTNTLDTIMYDAQRQGRVSFYMVSAGEEGIGVGTAAALGPDDQIFCQYREQGALIHRGLTLDEIMAQLYYTHNDEGKGRMMPVHYTNKGINLHPISSPLTSQLPHAAGAAYALKLANKQAVSVCYFGEGAASEGDFHAGLNIAATRNCPVVYVCRNNGYAISTPIASQYKGDGISSRAQGYGIPAVRVDGNDILAVYLATKKARSLAIKREGPVLLECMSYRVAHHSTSDDSFAYREKKEVNDWNQRDNPLTRFRKYLELRQLWSEEDEIAERSSVRKQILSKMQETEPHLKPPVSDLFTDVWAKPPKHLIEQQQELERLIKEYPESYATEQYSPESR